MGGIIDWIEGKASDATAAQQNAMGNQDVAHVIDTAAPRVIPTGMSAIGTPLFGANSAYSLPFQQMFNKKRPAAYQAPTPGGLQGPVLHNGVPMAGAEDLNFLKRGPLEQAYKEHGGAYWEPTRSDQFYDAMMREHGTPPKTSHYAEDAYLAALHGPTSAGLNPYYDNARRVAQEQIDQRLSARGMYGSSAADNAISEAMTNLGAEQANREADFALRREGLMGSLGAGADASSVAGVGSDRAWLGALGGLAGQADSANLNRLNSGMNAAGAVQGAQRTRGQDMFHNQLDAGNALSDMMGSWFKSMIGGDQSNFENEQNAHLGVATEKANQANANAIHDQNSYKDAATTAIGAVKPTLSTIDWIKEKNKAPTTNPQPASYATQAQYQYPAGAEYPYHSDFSQF